MRVRRSRTRWLETCSGAAVLTAARTRNKGTRRSAELAAGSKCLSVAVLAAGMPCQRGSARVRLQQRVAFAGELVWVPTAQSRGLGGTRRQWQQQQQQQQQQQSRDRRDDGKEYRAARDSHAFVIGRWARRYRHARVWQHTANRQPKAFGGGA
jgi:hypothetical protein